MNAATRPHGPYEANPMPFLAMFAIAGGVFVSAPAVVLGIALAPRRAAARGSRSRSSPRSALAWTAFAWRRHRAGDAPRRGARPCARARSSIPHAALAAAWPHIRTWWLLAAPLCFAVALGDRAPAPPLGRGAARARRAPRRTRPRQGRAQGAPGARRPRAAPRRDRAFELGQHVSGDHVLPAPPGPRADAAVAPAAHRARHRRAGLRQDDHARPPRLRRGDDERLAGHRHRRQGRPAHAAALRR